MSKHYIIDSYNFIHAVPRLKKILARDLEEAREELITDLTTFARRRNVTVTAVFDGSADVSAPGRTPGSVTVLFSGPWKNADQMIKDLVKTRGGKQTAVVSSDREIMNYARLYSCVILTSPQFGREMDTKKKSACGDTVMTKKNNPDLSGRELDEWRQLLTQAENSR